MTDRKEELARLRSLYHGEDSDDSVASNASSSSSGSDSMDADAAAVEHDHKVCKFV